MTPKFGGRASQECVRASSYHCLCSLHAIRKVRTSYDNATPLADAKLKLHRKFPIFDRRMQNGNIHKASDRHCAYYNWDPRAEMPIPNGMDIVFFYAGRVSFFSDSESQQTLVLIRRQNGFTPRGGQALAHGRSRGVAQKASGIPAPSKARTIETLSWKVACLCSLGSYRVPLSRTDTGSHTGWTCRGAIFDTPSTKRNPPGQD